MKKILAALGLLACLTLIVLPPSGCYWDNEEELYGTDPANCDTTGIRYSVEIKAILQNNCSSCHTAAGSTYSGISYETYDQFRTVALNGKLLDRINNQSAPMPQTGLMSVCNRQKIEAWVKAGAPNN